MILTEMVLQLEQEETSLDALTEYMRAVEEDPVFVEMLQYFMERMIGECIEGKFYKNEPVMTAKKANKILQDSMLMYRHLINVQEELAKLEGEKHD